MSHRDDRAVREALEVLDVAASGGGCLLSACRRIARLQGRLGSLPSGMLDPILAVESELDDIPDEEQASLWEKSAYEEQLRKKEEYLTHVRPWLLKSFRTLAMHLMDASSGGC